LKPPRSVLIVDGQEETREVLATVLKRRGVETFAAAGAPQGLRLAREHHPDLIVLDLELVEGAGDGLSAEFADQSRADRAPLVLLGMARRSEPPLSEGEFVSKPYHYAPLIRKIEGLLVRTAVPQSDVA
jgi:CheY-like chemotaxis protein